MPFLPARSPDGDVERAAGHSAQCDCDRSSQRHSKPANREGLAYGLLVTDSTDTYVGDDNGVYISRNGGATWAPYGPLVPHVTVFELEIQNNPARHV